MPTDDERARAQDSLERVTSIWGSSVDRVWGGDLKVEVIEWLELFGLEVLDEGDWVHVVR